jgi:cytochrome c-type biogenesis protein CcmE
MTQQNELALVHRLMHDLDSIVLPGQYDLQKAAMLALSALAQNIKLRYTLEQLQTELGTKGLRLMRGINND